jgi:hypothetical protein
MEERKKKRERERLELKWLKSTYVYDFGVHKYLPALGFAQSV